MRKIVKVPKNESLNIYQSYLMTFILTTLRFVCRSLEDDGIISYV